MWFKRRNNKEKPALSWNQIRLRTLLAATLVFSLTFWSVRQHWESYKRKKCVLTLKETVFVYSRGEPRSRLVKLILGDDGSASSVAQIQCEGSETQHVLSNSFHYFPKLDILEWNNELGVETLLHIDDAKHLRTITLKSFSLSYEELGAISRLKRLESIALSNCDWENGAFAQLGSLKNIKHLDLSYMDGMTIDDLKASESFCTLETLTMTRCNLTGSSILDWSALKSLTSIKLDRCIVSDELLEGIGTVPNLQSLDMAPCKYNLEKLQVLLTKCKTLKTLVLQPLTPPDDKLWETIAQLDKLETLELLGEHYNTHSHHILSYAKSLRTLYLQNPAAVDLDVLSKFSNLSELRLNNKSFDSAFIGQLQKIPLLRRLHLSNSNLGVDDLKLLLRNLPQLTYLDCFPNHNISQETLSSIQKDFPNIEFSAPQQLLYQGCYLRDDQMGTSR